MRRPIHVPGCLGLRGAAALGALLLAGCASPGRQDVGWMDLAERLRGLGPSVNAVEASLAAETACSYSLELAEEYRAVRPAIWHNVLVNVGLRERGLCFQWADDLSARLESLQLRTLQVRRGCARWETRREHSSVVLTTPGQAFAEGIVLDAWRHSGRLYWGGVKTDKYPWIEVVPAEKGAQPPPSPADNRQ